MKKVATPATVNSPSPPPSPAILSLLLLSLRLPYPVSLILRSLYLATSRSHATLVTNLNCSTSKVNALILPAGHRRNAYGILLFAAFSTSLRKPCREAFLGLPIRHVGTISTFRRSLDVISYPLSYLIIMHACGTIAQRHRVISSRNRRVILSFVRYCFFYLVETSN